MEMLRLDESIALRIRGLGRCTWTCSFGWLGLRIMAYHTTHVFNALLLKERKIDIRMVGSGDMTGVRLTYKLDRESTKK